MYHIGTLVKQLIVIMRAYLVGTFLVNRIYFEETRVINGVTFIKTNGKSFFHILNRQHFNELPNTMDYSIVKVVSLTEIFK